MILYRNSLLMISQRCIAAISPCNRIHTTSFQYDQGINQPDEHFRDSSSLWFTVLPRKSLTAMIRSGKRKAKGKPVFMPTGPLLISCKNKKLNHYKGMCYSKLAPIPLASKGWHSRKSKGDYFSILPNRKNPSFLLPENFPVEEMFDVNSCDPDEFKTLGVSEELINRLKNAGIYYPTSIQLAAIPKLLSGRSLVITGETGCGKTLAYVIPILEHIMRWKPKINPEYNSPLALIVLPSRELALQVENVVSSLIDGTDINCKVVLANRTKKFLLNFGESDLENVDVLISTLGVLCKYTYHSVYQLNRCLHVVFDEADTLLDDSFSNKMQALLSRCRFRGSEFEANEVPKFAQLSLVSATIPKDLDKTLENILPTGMLQRITTKYLHKILPHVKQNFIRCNKSAKPENILKLVKRGTQQKKSIIIFSNKTETCNWLAHFFRENGIECSRFNSQMPTDERVVELDKFREGRVNVITCTDLASRGQDIPRVSHVVNYEFPKYMADYIHRCGRTGRIGNEEKCEVTSYISSRTEVPLVREIETSARTERELPRVNNNIKRILHNKYNK